MADDIEERRADTVAVSRKAFQFWTALATAAFMGASGAIYSINNDVVRLSENIKFLNSFGPGTGKRFTADDGDAVKEDLAELKRWVLEMQKSVSAHHAKGEHPFADRRLNELERWRIDHHEKHDKTDQFRVFGFESKNSGE